METKHYGDKRPMTKFYAGEMLDVTSPEYLEIEISDSGNVIWIHVDGITVFRACRIANLTVHDNRKKLEGVQAPFERR